MVSNKQGSGGGLILYFVACLQKNSDPPSRSIFGDMSGKANARTQSSRRKNLASVVIGLRSRLY